MARTFPRKAFRFPRRLAFLAALVTLGSCASPTGVSDNSWRLNPGHVEKMVFAPFRNGRTCWVYLPPNYAVSSRRYPVLYLNDGESMFEADGGWHVNRICEDLIRGGQIEPLIVVAIENGPGYSRWIDYTPWHAAYGGIPNGGGAFYILAIRDTLKPEIDRRYRTLADAAHTAIGGASLGGLISAWAGIAHDSTFGRVAAFSPSYWWGYYGMERIVGSLSSKPKLVRFYQDTGVPDDNDIASMRDSMVARGFIPGVDFLSLEVPGGEHKGASWEHRFAGMLRFVMDKRLP